MWTATKVKEQLSRLPAALQSRLARLQAGRGTPLDLLWARPWEMMPEADPWQRRVLADRASSWLLCASRQSGKSTVVSRKAAWLALTEGKFVLVVSRSEKQAFEFFERVIEAYRTHPLVETTREPTMSELRLVNGGRVLALPHAESTILGYSSVDCLIMDEAARIHDAVFRAVRPMLAVRRGTMIALSTPFGQRGWFWHAWHECEQREKRGEPARYARAKVPWTLCPRITPEFIEQEKQDVTIGPDGVRQEYECEFLPASQSCCIDVEAMQALLDDMRGW